HCSNQDLAGELRISINAQRKRFAALCIWLPELSIEHIVCTDVHKNGVKLVCDMNEIEHGKSVHGIRDIGVRLTVVYPMVRCGVQHHVWTEIQQLFACLRMMGDVEIAASKRMDVMQAERAEKVLAELSIGAEQCNLHQFAKDNMIILGVTFC